MKVKGIKDRGTGIVPVTTKRQTGRFGATMHADRHRSSLCMLADESSSMDGAGVGVLIAEHVRRVVSHVVRPQRVGLVVVVPVRTTRRPESSTSRSTAAAGASRTVDDYTAAAGSTAEAAALGSTV